MKENESKQEHVEFEDIKSSLGSLTLQHWAAGSYDLESWWYEDGFKEKGIKELQALVDKFDPAIQELLDEGHLEELIGAAVINKLIEMQMREER